MFKIYKYKKNAFCDFDDQKVNRISFYYIKANYSNFGETCSLVVQLITKFLNFY